MVSLLEQMQVPNGTGPGVRRSDVLCWLAAPVVNVMETSQCKVITSKTVMRSSSVTMSRLSEMSYQWSDHVTIIPLREIEKPL